SSQMNSNEGSWGGSAETYHRDAVKSTFKPESIQRTIADLDVRSELGHYLEEHCRRQRLRTVGPGLLWPRVYFNDQPVGAHRDRPLRGGFDQASTAGAVRRIHDDRQVAQLIQQRDRRQIERVASHRLKCSNAALAQDHLVVAVGRDVLGGQQQFLY